MREIQILSLAVMTMGAVLADLRTGRIPNGLIVTGIGCGLFYQIFEKGAAGAVLFAGGAGLPILMLGVFYYFRMIGAGDIKLLCAVGGFVGPRSCLFCIAAAVLGGGGMAMILVFVRHSAVERIRCLTQFLRRYMETKQWEAYPGKADQHAAFCFSVPVLFAVLCYIGGVF